MNEQLPVQAQVPATISHGPPPMVMRPPPGPGDRIRHSASVLRRRWLPFLLVFIAVLSGVAAYTWMKTPEYTASATMLVNNRMVNVEIKSSETLPIASGDDRAVNAEAQILQSREVAGRVATRLARANPAWPVLLGGTPPQQRAVVDALLQRLRVERPGGTNVLAAVFRAPDAALAAFAANAFASEYVASKSDARLGAAQTVDTGLRRELETMRGRVEAAERAVADYRRANGLLSADGVTLTEQEQSLYKQQEAAAQTTLAEERARLTTARAQLRRGSAGDDVGEALGSAVVGGLRSQRAVASAKLAELESRYRPDHPKVVEARGEVSDIDTAIKSEIGRVVSNLEARVEVARQRQAAASGIASASRGELASNATATVRLNELERRAAALRTNYAGLLERQTTVASQATVADNDARILSSAEIPQRPSAPNKALNLVLGALLALTLAAAAVTVLHLLDQRFVTSAEVEEELGLHHLANIPQLERRRGAGFPSPADEVLDQPFAQFGEVMRGLLMLIERQRHDRATQIIGLTSAQPGEGKSTVAACLVRIAAASGRRVLLIEGDVRRPTLAATFGVTPPAGLLDVLAGRVMVGDAVVADPRSGAWLLLAVPDVSAQAAAVSTEARLRALMQQLDGVFDLVIIDTAPAMAAHESRLLMHFVDQALFIVRWRHTRAPVAKAALKRLRGLGVEPMGTVLTRVDMKAVAAFGWDDVDHDYNAWKSYFA